MHTHIIVYKRGSEEETVTIMAQAGMTTKAIAEALGLPESQAQYRIAKAQRAIGVRFRQEYRSGHGFSNLALSAITKPACARIQKHVAPMFIPLASSRINQ